MDPKALKRLRTETNHSLKLKLHKSEADLKTCTRQYEDLAKTYKNIVSFGRDFNKFSLKDTDVVLSMVVHIQTAKHNIRLMNAERNEIISILSDRVKPTPYISHPDGPWLHPEEKPQESLPSIDLDATGTARTLALEAMKHTLNNHPNSETQPLNLTTHSSAERQMQAVSNPAQFQQRRKSLLKCQRTKTNHNHKHKSESSSKVEKKSRPSSRADKVDKKRTHSRSPNRSKARDPRNPQSFNPTTQDPQKYAGAIPKTPQPSELPKPK